MMNLPVELAVPAPWRRRVRWFVRTGVVLILLTGCRAPSAAPPVDNAAPPDPQGATVTTTLRIEQHFSGSELALARAAAEGDATRVATLVREGADANAVSAGGLPLLAWPLLQGNVAGVEALLAHGADPNRAVPAAGTAMTWAAKADDPRILQAFLDRGGNANAGNVDGEPLTKVAALAGHWENVQLLVERGAVIDAHPPTVPGDTVLGYYSAGQFDKAHWLLERGADPGYRIEAAPRPERVGAQPIVENIYWWPVNADRFPQLAQWQQRCQDLLAARGYTAPAEPPHLQRLRASQSSSADTPGDGRERDLDAEIAEHETQLRERLRED